MPQAEHTVTVNRPPGEIFDYELTENPDHSTRVRFALDLQPAGLMKLMIPMISRQLRQEVAQLDNRKTILES